MSPLNVSTALAGLRHTRAQARPGMTLAASMQWDLLPPLTMRADRIVAAGLLEPAYEVAVAPARVAVG